MSEKDPSPLKASRVERMKSAAAKTGALAEAAVVSVTGVATMDAMVSPSVAHAGTEAAHLTEGAPLNESQSPQEFINNFDKRLAALAKQMPKSPYVKKMRDPVHSKAFHTDAYLMYMTVPSKAYPGKYDYITIFMREDNDVPLSSEVALGIKSESDTDYKEDYVVAQINDSGNLMSRSMMLADGKGPKYYEVSSEGYPSPLLPNWHAIKYSSEAHRAQIAAKYNHFLKLFKDIITRK
jgi:hypothetical protein